MVFDEAFATRYGIREAVILQTICFRCDQHTKEGNHTHKGYHWMWDTVRTFHELYPWWSVKQVRAGLESLEQQDAITTGRFNKKRYDKTKWYRPTEDIRKAWEAEHGK